MKGKTSYPTSSGQKEKNLCEDMDHRARQRFTCIGLEIKAQTHREILTRTGKTKPLTMYWLWDDDLRYSEARQTLGAHWGMVSFSLV